MLASLTSAQLTELLQISCDGLWAWDVDTDEVWWSEATFALMGRPEEARLSYRRVAELVHPDDLSAVEAAVESVLADASRPLSVSARIMHGSGHWLFLDIRAALVRSESGGAQHMVGFLVDRSVERTHFDRVGASERRLREVMDRCPAGLMIKDQDQRHVYANPALAKLIGVPVSQVLGRTAGQLFGGPEAERLAEIDARILEEGVAQESEHQLRVRTGHTRRVLDLKFPVPGPTPEERYLAGFVVDLTERDRKEQQLRKLEARIETMRRLESLGVLAGGIAHDFNNLLVGILGSADLARTHLASSPEAQEPLDMIVESSRQAARLCGKLMTYAGGTKAEIEPCSVPDLVHHLPALLKGQERSFSLEVAEGLPAVEADRLMLRQVFSNLLLNAVEATHEGGSITVNVGLEPSVRAREASFDWTTGADAHLVRFSVSDDGVGMDREQLRRVFDPFFSTKDSGHGLGLASALGVIRLHDGALKVKSAVGAGTVFDVFIPVARTTAQSGGTRLGEALGRVLVVDDEETVRRVLCRMLAQLELSCHSTGDGQSALEIVQAEPPDAFSAVILDLNMPGMTGAQVYDKLSSLRPELPVIISTGMDPAPPAIEAHKRATRLKKPYGFDELRAALTAAGLTLR